MLETMSASMTSEQAIAKSKELIPVLSERAVETEKLRHIPDKTFSDLVDSGLFRIVQPRRFGGAELPLAAAFQVVSNLSQGCGSAGWTYALMTSHSWLMSQFPDQAQRDVWEADPRSVASTSFSGGTPPDAEGEGCRIIEGKWRFSTGVRHADWVILRSELSRPDSPPEPYFLLVPKENVEIIDDWNVAGLAGTGSCSIVVRDAFIPWHRTLRVQDVMDGNSPGRKVNTGPLYKLPFLGSWQVFMVTTATGIARAAMDAWVVRANDRISKAAPSMYPAGEPGLVRLGNAAASIDTAEMLIRRVAENVMSEVTVAGAVSDDTQARGQRDYVFAVRLCVNAVEELFLSAGASSLHQNSPIQRCWRDVHAVAQHAALDFDRGLQAWGEKAFHGRPVL